MLIEVTVTTVNAVTTFTTVTIVNTVTALTKACTLCLGLSLYYHVLCTLLSNFGCVSIFVSTVESKTSYTRLL